jgi:adenosylmethionine-8-amino-7-oxononanoate aminotransferase
MQRYFFARGLLLRPLGNTVYIMPPYCVTDAELDLLYDAVAELVTELHHHPERIMG